MRKGQDSSEHFYFPVPNSKVVFKVFKVKPKVHTYKVEKLFLIVWPSDFGAADPLQNGVMSPLKSTNNALAFTWGV